MLGILIGAFLGIVAGALVWYGGMWLLVKILCRDDEEKRMEVRGPFKWVA